MLSVRLTSVTKTCLRRSANLRVQELRIPELGSKIVDLDSGKSSLRRLFVFVHNGISVL